MQCRYRGKIINLVPANTGDRMGLVNAVNIAPPHFGYPRGHRPMGLNDAVPTDAGEVQMSERFSWSRAYTWGTLWFVATIDLNKQFVNNIWFPSPYQY